MLNDLWGAAGDLKKMIAELGFDRAVDLAEFAAKHDRIKFLNHLTGAELAQVSTLFA